MKVPVAVNCSVMPSAIEGNAGVTTIDVNVAGVTVSSVEPEILPDVAAMVVLPTATLVARPCVPEALLIDAMLVALEVQFTVVVRSSVLPSL